MVKRAYEQSLSLCLHSLAFARTAVSEGMQLGTPSVRRSLFEIYLEREKVPKVAINKEPEADSIELASQPL